MDKLLSAAADALLPAVPALVASLVGFIMAWFGHREAVLNAARHALEQTLAESPEVDEEEGLDRAADKMQQQSFVARSMSKSRRKGIVAQLFNRMRNESSRPPSGHP